MAYIEITAGEIASGEPVAATTQTKIRDNFIDHEERLQEVEAISTDAPPIILTVNGGYADYGATDGVVFTTVNFTLVPTGVRILQFTPGASGTLQIDIKKKRGGGSFTSIFTSLPEIDYSEGSYALSDSGVVDPDEEECIAGDILRLDILSVQPGAVGFLVRIDWNRG